jgi:hypothetical protein
MHVELNAAERDLLLHLVDVAIRDIGPEIRHTDSRSYRDDLKEQRRELQRLHTVLASAGPRAGERSAPNLFGTP